MRSRASSSTAPERRRTSADPRPARPARPRTSRTRGSADTSRSSRRAYGSGTRRPRSRSTTSKASAPSSAGRSRPRSGAASCRPRPRTCRRSGSRRRRSPGRRRTARATTFPRRRRRRRRRSSTSTAAPWRRPRRAGTSRLYPFDRIDDAIGDGVERAVRAHHRRRLARIGHGQVFDASALGWAETGTFPVRAGNSVELLVDGVAALPRIAADVEAARSHVHLAGWYFTPGLRLGEGGPTLAELLGETAERVPVRVLAWAGAPLPLFHPDRGEVREMRDRLVHGTRIEVALDAQERPMHCHHEKPGLRDARISYVR